MVTMTTPAAFLGCLLLLASASITSAFGSPKPVSALLVEHADRISALKEEAASVSAADAPADDVFYLRYCLASYDDGDAGMKSALADNMRWRVSAGKSICDAAAGAVSEATASGSWDNDPVRAAAPHAPAVNKYITPSQCVTTTSRPGDLVFCIRAGSIDDVALMSEVSVEGMTDFFLYCREVNARVANLRSAESDRLCSLITANDLKGVKLIGGDATFRKALSAASNKASDLYPSLAGPTLLLNLPKLLGALVKIFTPLFSEEVRKRLKFAQGPLNDVDDLSDVLAGGPREKFLNYLDDLVYSD